MSIAFFPISEAMPSLPSSSARIMHEALDEKMGMPSLRKPCFVEEDREKEGIDEGKPKAVFTKEQPLLLPDLANFSVEDETM